MAQPRNKGVFIYLSEDEKTNLKRRAISAGMSISDYIRFCVFKEVGIKLSLKKIDLKVDKAIEMLERFE